MAHLRQRADDGRVERDADPERAERREPRHLAEREREREFAVGRPRSTVCVCACVIVVSCDFPGRAGSPRHGRGSDALRLLVG